MLLNLIGVLFFSGFVAFAPLCGTQEISLEGIVNSIKKKNRDAARSSHLAPMEPHAPYIVISVTFDTKYLISFKLAQPLESNAVICKQTKHQQKNSALFFSSEHPTQKKSNYEMN